MALWAMAGQRDEVQAAGFGGAAFDVIDHQMRAALQMEYRGEPRDSEDVDR